ncbi:MAG TPA: serine/threonine protein phosphatase [Pseudonocardiaceae bacterium]
MRVRAARQARRATWHHEAGEVLTAGVWTERAAGLGEDAEPLLAHHRPSGHGLLAVFDGAGGSGAGLAGHNGDGVPRSGAWVAARVARATTEEWFHEVVTRRTGDDPETLRLALSERLGHMHRPGARSILGTMRRALPTTVAALRYRPHPAGLAWQAYWAGDSRCFLLDPAHGLQQVSRDDTEESDALVLLTQDPPMTNVACADREFRVNRAAGETALPVTMVCATDGFFGYVHTPAGFEHVLLSTLAAARDLGHWAELLADDVTGYTGDDASLAVVAIGHGGFGELRARFAGRTRYVADEHWLPLRHALGGGHEQVATARADSWSRYRHGYERLMPWPGGTS